MSGPYFSSRDQDEYDASQMSLKSLEWQTQDHPIDCDCAFCEAKERRRADENDEPETPTMPKIETPEVFAEKLSDRQHTAPYIASLITARDAAIRAESAELLRVCGEALNGVVLANGPRTKQGYFADCTCDECVAVRKAQAALAALKDAGVRV